MSERSEMSWRSETKATKHDDGKPDMTLVTKMGLLPLVRTLEYGIKKYNRDNYKKGHKIQQLLAACKRHLDEICDGNWYDDESGVAHIGHAMACLYMLQVQIQLGTVKELETFGFKLSEIKDAKREVSPKHSQDFTISGRQTIQTQQTSGWGDHVYDALLYADREIDPSLSGWRNV